MKKQVGILIALTIALSFISFVSAIPPEPMAFYGKVSYADGTTIPDGYFIVAKIGTVVSGECPVVNGFYGMNSNTCVVVTHATSPKVEFFLGEYKLAEYTFKAKEIVNLSLIVTTLPPRDLPSISNGICEPSRGECSYNILDCDNSITKICAGNGVCDAVIGETCLNSAGDCGTCAFCGDGSCNNGESCSTCPGDCGACSSGGSSGGGGGGGGGGSSTRKAPVISLSNSTNQTTNTTIPNNSLILSPEKTEEENQSEAISEKGITGRTIDGITSFAKSKIGIGLIIFIVLFILFVILTSDKKLREENKRNKEIKIVKQSEKIKEEKIKTEKAKVEKKKEPIKNKIEKPKVEKSKIVEKKPEIAKPTEEKKPEESKNEELK
jgi:uncharacterized membrane protein YgcG